MNPGKSARRGNYFAALPVRVPDGWMESLKEDAPVALRWFHPDDLHLTLAFFGPGVEQRIPALLDLLREIPYPGGTATPGRLLALPQPRRFSALAFGPGHGGDAVAELIGAWRPRLLEAAGCRPDPRPPLPHLTIARPNRRDPSFSRRVILEWLEAVEPPHGDIGILAPALYGWSTERPRRQFRRIGGAGNGPGNGGP